MQEGDNPDSSVGNGKVVQPSQGFVKEQQPQTNEPAASPTRTDSPRQADLTSLVPASQVTENTTNLPNSTTVEVTLGHKRKAILYVPVIIFLLLAVGTFAYKAFFTSQDQITPSSDFQTYTTSFNGASISLLFYKNSTVSTNVPQLTSPQLSGGRLPISLGLGAVSVSIAAKQEIPCMNNQSALVFTGQLKSSNTPVYVCRIASMAGGGPYIYFAYFSDTRFNYRLQISEIGDKNISPKQFNLNDSASDIKTIVNSIQAN